MASESVAVGVEVRRGEGAESLHHVDVAVVELSSDGPRRVAWFGDPTRPTWLRSAWKPLQAAISWECGLAGLGFVPGSRELAIMAASHGATGPQLDAVRAVLAATGLSEAALRNGTHEPLSQAGRELLAREGGRPTAVHGNCSGKHAGMLAACVARGWPTDDYLDPGHPLQQRVHHRLAELMEVPLEAVTSGGDGCGLPTWCAPLEATALAFAKLSLDPEAGSLGAVGAAMAAHPELLGDPDGFNVELMQACPGLLAKSGAEGVYGCALPERRLGFALKVLDGNHRAAAPACLAVLRQLGLLPDGVAERLAPFVEPVVNDLLGRPAGCLRAVLELRS